SSTKGKKRGAAWKWNRTSDRRWTLSRGCSRPALGRRFRRSATSTLVESPRTPDLAPERERHPELDPDHGPAGVQHHAQDAVDAEPVVPEAGVGGRTDPFAFTTPRVHSTRPAP